MEDKENVCTCRIVFFPLLEQQTTGSTQLPKNENEKDKDKDGKCSLRVIMTY